MLKIAVPVDEPSDYDYTGGLSWEKRLVEHLRKAVVLTVAGFFEFLLQPFAVSHIPQVDQ
jgi:hypothetical protein